MCDDKTGVEKYLITQRIKVKIQLKQIFVIAI